LSAGRIQTAEAGFHDLSDSAQTAILIELGLGGGGSAKSASKEQLAVFADSPEGHELTDFWQHRTAKNLGMALQRIGRIEAGMSAAEFDSTLEWFEGLSGRAKVVALCVLAGYRKFEY